jgi:cytochrome c55X
MNPSIARLLFALMPAIALAEPDAARLEYLLQQDCGSCHGLSLKGGLGSDLRASRLSGREEAVLAHAIREGVPGAAMPPWKALLSEDEITWLAARLKRGTP